jgi:hypothetical protein
MFNQLLTPVGGGLFASFLLAALPIATVLVALACTMHEGTDFHDHARKFGDVRA